jgi:hypothetical protein
MSCERQCSVAERVYRLMLLAYCSGFRERYGQQMIEAFRDGQRESCQTGGYKTLLQFWLLIVRDWAGSSSLRFYCVAATAVALFLGSIFLGGRISTPMQHPSQPIQVARAAPTEENTLGPVGHSRATIRSVHLHNSHLSVGRQDSVSQTGVFNLVRPAILFAEASPGESKPRQFKLIGDSSINHTE